MDSDTAPVIVSCSQKDCLTRAQELAPIVAACFPEEEILPTIKEILIQMGQAEQSRLP
jgi:hypothetical protein